MRGGIAKSKTGFQFNVQKQSLPEVSGGSLTKILTQTLGLRVISLAGSPLVVHLPGLPILGKTGAMGTAIPDVLQSTT